MSFTNESKNIKRVMTNNLDITKMEVTDALNMFSVETATHAVRMLRQALFMWRICPENPMCALPQKFWEDNKIKNLQNFAEWSSQYNGWSWKTIHDRVLAGIGASVLHPGSSGTRLLNRVIGGDLEVKGVLHQSQYIAAGLLSSERPNQKLLPRECERGLIYRIVVSVGVDSPVSARELIARVLETREEIRRASPVRNIVELAGRAATSAKAIKVVSTVLSSRNINDIQLDRMARLLKDRGYKVTAPKKVAF